MKKEIYPHPKEIKPKKFEKTFRKAALVIPLLILPLKAEAAHFQAPDLHPCDTPEKLDKLWNESRDMPDQTQFLREHGCVVYEDSTPQKPADNSPEMLEARRALRADEGRIVEEIKSGKNIQNLTSEEKQLLHKDDEYMKARFPKLNETQRHELEGIEELKPGEQRKSVHVTRKWDEAYIVQDPEDVITAWRLNKGNGRWERAGWDAPKDSDIKTEDDAFRSSRFNPNGEPVPDIGKRL